MMRREAGDAARELEMATARREAAIEARREAAEETKRVAAEVEQRVGLMVADRAPTAAPAVAVADGHRRGIGRLPAGQGLDGAPLAGVERLFGVRAARMNAPPPAPKPASKWGDPIEAQRAANARVAPGVVKGANAGDKTVAEVVSKSPEERERLRRAAAAALH